MNAECRLMNNSRVVKPIDQYLPVFSSNCLYLPVNTAGMENTHICQHFANLGSNAVCLQKVLTEP